MTTHDERASARRVRWSLAATCVVFAVSSWTSLTLLRGWGGRDLCFDLGGTNAPARVVEPGAPRVERDLLRRTVTCSWTVPDGTAPYEVVIADDEPAATATVGMFALASAGFAAAAIRADRRPE